MNDPDPAGIILPVEWHIPEGALTRYATHLFIQRTEHEFILSFFEALPPLFLGSPDEAHDESLTAARAECVARIVVNPKRMAEFVEIFRKIPDGA